MELVKARVDVIAAVGDETVRAIQQATKTIPIVALTDDLFASGFVNSLGRPYFIRIATVFSQSDLRPDNGRVGSVRVSGAADYTDHEHYRVGQIATAVGDCYLIQFDKLKDLEDHPLPPMELYTLEELSEVCENCGQKLANLFKSRADMERWIAWLNEPEEFVGQSGKIVHLKKPH